MHKARAGSFIPMKYTILKMCILPTLYIIYRVCNHINQLHAKTPFTLS